MASLTIIISLILLASTTKLASPSISCSDLVPDSYDAMQAPSDGSNETVQVAFQLSVMNIAKVNVQDQTFSIKLRIILDWKDARLSESAKLSPYINRHLDANFYDCFWTPFFTTPDTDREELTMERYLFLWNGSNRGNVRYIRYYKNLVSCPMNFTWYPMDVQTCALMFASWKPDYVKLIWSEAKTFKDVLRQESAYDVTIARGGICPLQPKPLSCLRVNLKFRRRLGMYLMTTYFPSSLIVIVSFISFWIDPLSVPGRMTLTVTSLLALMTQFISVRDPLSDVNHVTAIDVWFMGCILQVALTMFEFCLTHFLARLDAGKGVRVNMYESVAEAGGLASQSKFKSAVQLALKRIKGKLLSTDYDVYSRIIFPTIFITYTVIYWVMLISYSTK